MNDFQMFTVMRNSDAYKKLMFHWLQDVTDVEAKRDRAAAGKSEGNWRYYAGLEKGFKRAMMKLDELLIQLNESKADDPMEKPSEQIEKLLEEARGK